MITSFDYGVRTHTIMGIQFFNQYNNKFVYIYIYI